MSSSSLPVNHYFIRRPNVRRATQIFADVFWVRDAAPLHGDTGRHHPWSLAKSHGGRVRLRYRHVESLYYDDMAYWSSRPPKGSSAIGHEK